MRGVWVNVDFEDHCRFDGEKFNSKINFIDMMSNPNHSNLPLPTMLEQGELQRNGKTKSKQDEQILFLF